jgi:hypothetical protein
MAGGCGATAKANSSAGRRACSTASSAACDFRLIDRKVVEAFRAMPERDRFVRGMFAWLGFRQTEVAFHRLPRFAGETKYPFWKMLKLAVSGALSFSEAPLRLAIWCGVAVSALAMLYGIYVMAAWLANDEFVRGWSSTIVIISFLCGLNMLMTGIIGLYIGRIHAEVKRRPLYVVAQQVGFECAARAADSARHQFRGDMTREVPVREVPVREVPVREVPVREVPVREVPVREVPVREVPVREVSAREG